MTETRKLTLTQLLTDLQNLPVFLQFSHCGIFLSWSHQDPTLHLVVVSPYTFSSLGLFLSLCLSWHLWRALACYILGCLFLWVCLIFFQEWIKVVHFWEECLRGDLGSLSAPHLRGTWDPCLTAGYVNLDLLVKVLSSGFSYKVTIVSFVISKYLVGRHWDFANMSLSNQGVYLFNVSWFLLFAVFCFKN